MKNDTTTNASVTIQASNTRTITNPEQLLAGHTFECGICGKPFKSDNDGASIRFFGHVIEGMCSKCAKRNFERDAQEFVMLHFATKLEADTIPREHYLQGFGDGTTVHLRSHQQAAITLERLRSLGVSALLMGDEARVTVKIEHGDVLRQVVKQVQAEDSSGKEATV